MSISNVISDVVQIFRIIGLQRESTAKAVDHHLKTDLYQTVEDFRIIRQVLGKTSDLFHLPQDTPDSTRRAVGHVEEDGVLKNPRSKGAHHSTLG